MWGSQISSDCRSAVKHLKKDHLYIFGDLTHHARISNLMDLTANGYTHFNTLIGWSYFQNYFTGSTGI